MSLRSDCQVHGTTCVAISVSSHWRDVDHESTSRFGRELSRNEDDDRRASVPASLRDADVVLDRFVEMRYSLQVNELRIPAPSGPYGQAEIDELILRFEGEYELLFGRGSGYPAAGFRITSLRVIASSSVTEHEFVASDAVEVVEVEPASHRDVVWYEVDSTPRRTPFYDGGRLKPGDVWKARQSSSSSTPRSSFEGASAPPSMPAAASSSSRANEHASSHPARVYTPIWRRLTMTVGLLQDRVLAITGAEG